MQNLLRFLINFEIKSHYLHVVISRWDGDEFELIGMETILCVLLLASENLLSFTTDTSFPILCAQEDDNLNHLEAVCHRIDAWHDLVFD